MDEEKPVEIKRRFGIHLPNICNLKRLIKYINDVVSHEKKAKIKQPRKDKIRAFKFEGSPKYFTSHHRLILFELLEQVSFEAGDSDATGIVETLYTIENFASMRDSIVEMFHLNLLNFDISPPNIHDIAHVDKSNLTPEEKKILDLSCVRANNAMLDNAEESEEMKEHLKTLGLTEAEINSSLSELKNVFNAENFTLFENDD